MGNNKVIKSTLGVNSAIQNASQLRKNLVQNKPPLKLQSGKSSTAGEAATSDTGSGMFLCEIINEEAPGIYEVKAFMNPTDLSVYETRYLIALDMLFENVYYPGKRLFASSSQINSYSVT